MSQTTVSQSSSLPGHVQFLLEDRYFNEGETQWSQAVQRIIDHVYQHDSNKSEKLRAQRLLEERVFLPNSPTIVNAGTENSGLMACFVVGPTEDTLENHFDTLKHIAEVAKRGGGCGLTGSNIRPENSPVAGSAHGYAYGPLKYAENVSRSMDMMTQAGFRKMALMFTLDADHDDAERFIDMKQTTDEDYCYNFNQSLMVSDDWMETAILDPTSEQGQMLEKIAENIYNNGEPGLLFKDKFNRSYSMGGAQETSPYAVTGQPIQATNPCGEQPLPAYGSCNLGSINLAHDKFFDDSGKYDFEELAIVAQVATRFLDNVGSTNKFPNQKFASWYRENRPIGLGIMGFADALLKLEMVYGSEASLDFLEQAMSTIYKNADLTSQALGVEKGFPEQAGKLGRRNITLTSIAPTGSISIIADCSSGIEPVFAKAWTRKDENGNEYKFVHPMKDQKHFRCAISKDKSMVPVWHQELEVQRSVQKWVDSGVSKTINLNSSATVADVRNALIYAYKAGCKGVTMYVSGSRDAEVLTADPEEEAMQDCAGGQCDI